MRLAAILLLAIMIPANSTTQPIAVSGTCAPRSFFVAQIAQSGMKQEIVGERPGLFIEEWSNTTAWIGVVTRAGTSCILASGVRT